MPAVNEVGRIGKVLRELKPYEIPVIVVDDGSKDDTAKIAEREGAIVLKHKINLGKGAGMKTGALAAFHLGADAVIFMDADGQHKAGDLPKFIKALGKGYDVVFGSRHLNLGAPLVRSLGNKFAPFLINFMFRIKVSDLTCGFRALTRKAYKIINWQSIRYGVETEMVAMTGKFKLKYCEVPVRTVYYDKFKGTTILDAVSILFEVIYWRLTR